MRWRQLGALIVSLMVGSGHAAGGRAYAETSSALLAQRGEVALVNWQFGIALTQVSELARQAVRAAQPSASGFDALPGGARIDIVRSLGQTLAPLGEDLGGVLLLAAVGQISVDEAALLLSRPVATARMQVQTRSQAFLARLHQDESVAA